MMGGKQIEKKNVENVKWLSGVFKEFATISQNSTINKEKCRHWQPTKTINKHKMHAYTHWSLLWPINFHSYDWVDQREQKTTSPPKCLLSLLLYKFYEKEQSMDYIKSNELDDRSMCHTWNRVWKNWTVSEFSTKKTNFLPHLLYSVSSVVVILNKYIVRSQVFQFQLQEFVFVR